MIEVEENPISKVIIDRFQSYTLEEFIEAEANGSGRVGWCNGVYYSVSSYPNSPIIIKEEIEGIKRFHRICYAVGEFNSVLTNKENIKTSVVNLSKDDMISDIIKYVKKRDKLG